MSPNIWFEFCASMPSMILTETRQNNHSKFSYKVVLRLYSELIRVSKWVHWVISDCNCNGLLRQYYGKEGMGSLSS